MQNSAYPDISITPAIDLCRRVKRAVGDLFGISDKAREISALADRLESETAQVMDHRVPGTVIALVGGKNMGKTTLASLLVEEDNTAEELRRHAGVSNDTLRMTWVGVTALGDLDSTREEFLRGTPVLGRDCWLLDCPSFAGISTSERDSAQYALLLADVNVLIVDEITMRAGINATALEAADGSVILPVVRKGGLAADWHEGANERGFCDSVVNFIQRLRSHLPGSRITEAVVVPEFKQWGSTAEEARQAVEHCRSLVREALRRALREQRTGSRRETMVRNKVKEFRMELQRKFTDASRLRSPLEKLDEQQRNLPVTVAENLLGSEMLLRTGVRSHALWRAPSEVWMIWFPFRSITWLLALTGGAWDRLVLAMAGSLPSLALTYFSAARNVRSLSQIKRQAQSALRPRFERALVDRLRPALCEFQDGVGALLEPDEKQNVPRNALSSADLRICGFDAVREASATIFAKCLEAHRVPRWWLQFCGLAATSFFGWLLWHPLRALYERFLQASAWEDFPAPATSMVLTSVLLSTIPVLVLGVVCLSFGIAMARVGACAASIRERHMQEIAKLAANGTLRLELANPQVEAARFLLSLTTPE